jgi:two-component system, OmpR family, KDP operon response regulator KdpE
MFWWSMMKTSARFCPAQPGSTRIQSLDRIQWAGSAGNLQKREHSTRYYGYHDASHGRAGNLRRIRQGSHVPIIILTAMGEEADKVRAFDLGADDYLTKPFGVGELLGRIKAVLRRADWSEPASSEERIVRGDIEVDLELHNVTVRGKPINLTPTEFNLLVYFMKNAGKTLHHRAILQHVWGMEYGDEAEYLRVYVGKLRHKIENDPLKPQYLHTEHGIGYRFEG